MSRTLVMLSLVAVAGCKKPEAPGSGPAQAKPAGDKQYLVGLVTDVGGRGDQSFNDSALRGLELWAAQTRFDNGKSEAVPQKEIAASIPLDLKEMIAPLPVKPLVLQSKAQEDYQPNLQLLVDKGCDLTVGIGFMLEN